MVEAGTIKQAVENALKNVKPKILIEDFSTLLTDLPVSIASGEEADFLNFTLSNSYYNYGVTRCYGNVSLKAGSKLKICAGSVFRIVR